MTRPLERMTDRACHSHYHSVEPPPRGVHLQDPRRFTLERADPVRHGQTVRMLIDRMYSWRGLTPVGSHHGPHHNHHRTTLVTSSADEVFGTITVGIDSPAGLQADPLYRHELDAFRQRGRLLCEITGLAVDSPVQAKEALGGLFHLAYIQARLIDKADDVVIEVNPRHAPFYQRLLGFGQIGPLRHCQRVNAPAVLLHLAISHMDDHIARFGGTSPKHTRTLYPYFFSLAEQAALLAQMQQAAN